MPTIEPESINIDEDYEEKIENSNPSQEKIPSKNANDISFSLNENEDYYMRVSSPLNRSNIESQRTGLNEINVYNVNSNNNSQIINASSLSNGIYFFNLHDADFYDFNFNSSSTNTMFLVDNNSLKPNSNISSKGICLINN